MPRINAKYEFEITFEGFSTIQLKGLFFFFLPQRQEKENMLHNKNLNCISALYYLMLPDMMLRKTYLLESYTMTD